MQRLGLSAVLQGLQEEDINNTLLTNNEPSLINSALECLQYLLYSDIYNLHLRNQIRFILQDIKTDQATYDKKLSTLEERIALIFYSQKNCFFRGKDKLIKNEMIYFLDALKNKKINRLNEIRLSKTRNLNKDAELCVLLIKKIEKNNFGETSENLPGSNKKVSSIAYNVYMKAIDVYNQRNNNIRYEMLQTIRNLLSEDKQKSVASKSDNQTKSSISESDSKTTQFHQKLFKLVDAHIRKGHRFLKSDTDPEPPVNKKMRF